MDWLRFKLCALIWVLSITKSQSQVLRNTEVTCMKDLPIQQPDDCNTCICFLGQIHCTQLTCSARNNTVAEQVCINDVDIPKPDECNQCICHHGSIACTNLLCISEPQCIDGDKYPAPDYCNECSCKKGYIVCTNKKCDSNNSSSRDPECVRGEHIPKPDNCNDCICYEGEIHCTHLPCRVQTRSEPECVEGQPVYKPDECNECYCFDGRLECSDLICIRGSKCTEGQVIPKPDTCNVCKCFEGHILCTNYQCYANPKLLLSAEDSMTEVKPLQQCQEGDYIPPPSPPDDCNNCSCVNERIFCTKENCTNNEPDDDLSLSFELTDTVARRLVIQYRCQFTYTTLNDDDDEFGVRLECHIKARFILQKDQQNNRGLYDNQISIEPFIDMIYKKYDKLPTKLIHTHAYNGFHQEIKVHSTHLHKDASELIKALSKTLDNPALNDISAKIKLSSYNEMKTSVIPQVDESNLPSVPITEGNVHSKYSLDSSEIHLSHSITSSITAGSQSNETIIVIPDSVTFSNQNTESMLPVSNEYETHSNSSSSAPQVNTKFQIVTPLKAESANLLSEEKEYSSHKPLVNTSVHQFSVPQNNSNAGLTNQVNIYPTSTTRNTVDLDYQFPKQTSLIHTKLIHINDDKINPAHNRYTQNPPRGVIHLDKFKPINIYPPNKQANKNYKFNLKPSQDYIGYTSTQNRPHYLQTESNPSLYNTNPFNPAQTLFKPDQKYQVSALNNKGSLYNSPQFRYKSNQDKYIPTLNKNRPPRSQFKINPTIYHINNFISQDHHRPGLSFAHLTYTPQYNRNYSLFVPNPKIYDTKTPETGLKPSISATDDKSSQYETYTTVTYVTKLNTSHIENLTDQDKMIPTPGDRGPYNPSHLNHNNELDTIKISQLESPKTEFNLDKGLHESDLIMSKLNEYSNLNDQHILDQYENKPHVPIPKFSQYYSSQLKFDPNKGQNETLHVLQPEIIEDNKNSPHYNKNNLSMNNNNQTGINLGFNPNINQNIAGTPTFNKISKDNQYSPEQTRFQLPQNHSKIGFFDNRGSSNGFKYVPNAVQDPKVRRPQHQFQLSQTHPKIGAFDDRGSADGFQYISISAEDPTMPKVNQNKTPQSQFVPTIHQLTAGIFDDRGSPDGFQYVSPSIKDSKIRKVQHKPFQSDLSSDQPKTGIFDDRWSSDGFEYIINSAEDPSIPKINQHKPYQSQFEQPIQQPKIGNTNDRGSPDEFQYMSNAAQDTKVDQRPQYQFQFPQDNPEAKDHTILKVKQYNPPQSQFKPPVHQPKSGIFDDRGSADEFQYVSPSIEDTKILKVQHKPTHSQFDLSSHQPKTGIFDDRWSSDGFEYVTNSAEDPSIPKINQHKPYQSQFEHSIQQPKIGNTNDRGSPDEFQYMSNAAQDTKVDQRPQYQFQFPQDNPEAKDHTILKVKQYNPPQSQFKPSVHQPKSGIFDDRGSADEFQYVSPSIEDTKILKVQHKPTHSQFDLSSHQPKTGIFDDRWSSDGFEYVTNSAEDPSIPKINQHKPYQSQFEHSIQQPKIGNTNDRGSPDEFQYMSNAAQDTKVDQRPQYQFQFPQNNPVAKKHTILKVKQYNPPQSQFKPPVHQPKSGIFDDRGSADGFQYVSPSIEDTKIPKVQHKPTHSQSDLSPHQPKTGIFDDRGSSDGFEYIPNSAENPAIPKVNQYKPPQPQFEHPLQIPKIGNIDDHASPDVFHYMSNAVQDTKVNQRPQYQFQLPQNHPQAKNLTDPKVKQYNPPESQFKSPVHQPKSGIFDDRGSSDGFEYISNFAEDPSIPKVNQHNPSLSQFENFLQQPKTQNTDHRGSPAGFLYMPNAVQDTKVNQRPQYQFQLPQNHPKYKNLFLQDQHNLPQSQFKYPLHQPKTGIFDGRGSADRLQYIYPSDEDTKITKLQYKPFQPRFKVPLQQAKTELFDNHGTSDGFQYMANAAQDPKVNLRPQYQFQLPRNFPNTGAFDNRGSADRFQYISPSVKESKIPKVQYKQPQSLFGHSLHQPKTGIFSDRGSSDGFQYISPFDENHKIPKVNENRRPQSQFNFLQAQSKPWTGDGRDDPNRLGYKTNTEESTILKTNEYKNSPSRLRPKQSRYEPTTLPSLPKLSKDNQYYNKYNSLIPQINPDHDQYKPSSFDNLLNGVHYIPWSLPDENKNILNSNNISNTQLWLKPNQDQYKPLSDENKGVFNSSDISNAQPWLQPDRDQYKPSSDDKMFNGIHHIPWSPKLDKKLLSSIIEFTTLRPTFYPEHDQYRPSSFDNLLNGIHQTPWYFPKEDTFSSETGSLISQPWLSPVQDQYKPSSLDKIVESFNISLFPLSDQNLNMSIYDEVSDHDKDKSTLTFGITDSESNQYTTLHPRFKPDRGIPIYENQINSLLKAANKLNEPTSFNDLDFTLGDFNPLELLPLILSAISPSNILKPSPDQEKDLSINNLEIIKKYPWMVPQDIQSQANPVEKNDILNWLMSYQNKYSPSKYNLTVSIEGPSDKNSKEIHDIFNAGTVTDNGSKVKQIYTTQDPYTESTINFQNQPRFMHLPKSAEDKQYQSPLVQYPDVHIILHPHNAGDDDKTQYVENDAMTQFNDVNEGELNTSFLPKLLHSRYRYKLKDQKEECGEGTEWIRNCHGCSCRGGKAMCYKIPECILRPLGEPMMCKPYSHFKMDDCYSCECNGDGVAECDATECQTELGSDEEKNRDSDEFKLPVYANFYDAKKTRELLKYYNFFKKLPKESLTETIYPTCESGTTWISSCHECECNDTGKHECTKIEECELDYELHGKPTRCKPNSKFYPKTTSMPCVECMCDDEGNPYCPVADYKRQ